MDVRSHANSKIESSEIIIITIVKNKHPFIYGFIHTNSSGTFSRNNIKLHYEYILPWRTALFIP